MTTHKTEITMLAPTGLRLDFAMIEGEVIPLKKVKSTARERASMTPGVVYIKRTNSRKK